MSLPRAQGTSSSARSRQTVDTSHRAQPTATATYGQLTAEGARPGGCPATLTSARPSAGRGRTGAGTGGASWRRPLTTVPSGYGSRAPRRPSPSTCQSSGRNLPPRPPQEEQRRHASATASTTAAPGVKGPEPPQAQASGVSTADRRQRRRCKKPRPRLAGPARRRGLGRRRWRRRPLGRRWRRRVQRAGGGATVCRRRGLSRASSGRGDRGGNILCVVCVFSYVDTSASSNIVNSCGAPLIGTPSTTPAKHWRAGCTPFASAQLTAPAF